MTERHDPAPTPPPHSGSFGSPLRLKKIPSAIAAGLIFVMLGLGAWWGIERSRNWLSAQPDYLIDVDRIELVPDPPAQLRDGRTGILRSVRDGARLKAPIRLLDADLDALGKSFVLHSPWIARVVRIDRSQLKRLIVEVVYRIPLARVEIGGQPRQVLGNDGAVLPSEEMSAKDRAELPVIVGLDNVPETSPGLYFGDDGNGKIQPKVAAAVAMAEFFRINAPSSVALRKIIVSLGSNDLSITTRDGLAVYWRHAPGQEVEGEPTAADKLDLVKRWQAAMSKLISVSPNDVPPFLQIDVSKGPAHVMVQTKDKVWVHWRHIPGEEADDELSFAEKRECLRLWELSRGNKPVNAGDYLELNRQGARLRTEN